MLFNLEASNLVAKTHGKKVIHSRNITSYIPRNLSLANSNHEGLHQWLPKFLGLKLHFDVKKFPVTTDISGNPRWGHNPEVKKHGIRFKKAAAMGW